MKRFYRVDSQREVFSFLAILVGQRFSYTEVGKLIAVHQSLKQPDLKDLEYVIEYEAAEELRLPEDDGCGE